MLTKKRTADGRQTSVAKTMRQARQMRHLNVETVTRQRQANDRQQESSERRQARLRDDRYK